MTITEQPAALTLLAKFVESTKAVVMVRRLIQVDSEHLAPERVDSCIRGAQEAQEANTDAGADTNTDARAVNDTHKSGRARKPKRHLRIVRIAQSVTPVTVIHPTASA
jgi:hypothetical protein